MWTHCSVSRSGNLVTRGTEKAQVLNAFFPQFALVRSALWPPRSLSLLAVCRCGAEPTRAEHRIREYLTHLDIQVGPGGMHLRV